MYLICFCGAAWSMERGNLVSFLVFFSLHRMMHRFGGCHLGCACCASGSWSDLSRVIGRDHFFSVCLGSFHDRMLYSIVCCYPFYKSIKHHLL
jgi:hypothetical protein